MRPFIRTQFFVAAFTLASLIAWFFYIKITDPYAQDRHGTVWRLEHTPVGFVFAGIFAMFAMAVVYQLNHFNETGKYPFYFLFPKSRERVRQRKHEIETKSE
jgi:hypothetical protein